MADTDFDPDVLTLTPGETIPQRLVRSALVGVGCSATKLKPIYERVVVRPSDRTPAKLPYYMNDPKLSTCQLEQMAIVRMVGGGFFEAPYVPGAASAEQDAVYNAHGAMYSPPKGWELDLVASDGFWIDNGTGYDLHAITTIADPIAVVPGVYTVETVEGGQADIMGSTLTNRFTRTLTLKNGRWYMGARYIIRVLRSRLLPIPTYIADPGGPADDGSVPAAPSIT
jgi:hypothetical protein